MKHVLIAGSSSFIGKAFEAWAQAYFSDDLQVSSISLRGNEWRKAEFSKFDAILFCCGIAHVDTGRLSRREKLEYYRVNRDLCLLAAKKAKREGVSQFIFLSSAIIYGEAAPCGQRKRITEKTEPSPSSVYGDSKWQADRLVRELASGNFHVAVLRLPMVYGKGSKGNYPRLSAMAKRLPVFPDLDNERSMLHIDNLTELLCRLILEGSGGIFFPQNAEYVRTTDLVREIARVNEHRIRIVKGFGPFIYVFSRLPGRLPRMVSKAFGSLSYDEEMSVCGFDYRITDFRTSIERTEL